MNKILKNHQIPSAIIDLIENSKEYCFLVSPYFKPWPLLLRAFEKSAIQKKNLVFLARYDDNHQHLSDLNKKYEFDVILIDNLHTKLYLNEKAVIISSMNLYDSSKENNFEIGYLMDNKTTAKDFFQEIIKNDLLGVKPKKYLKGRYSKLLLESREEPRKVNQQFHQDKNKSNSFNMDFGYCIRCHKEIPLNMAITMCDSCYSTWAFFGNPEFPEKFCHSCGKENETTKNRPFCYTCFKEL